MTAIRLAAASNVRSFQTLANALVTSDGRWTNSIDIEGLEDEFGRFRVWSGNLGALQKGHSSLDYRLRDSPLLSGNTLKFLEELNDNLNEALAIISGARLPYEDQPKPDSDDKSDAENDDEFFSEDEEDEDRGSRNELTMRYEEIVDIVDNLYKLSVRIRTPTIRSRSLKAASYQPKDPDSGVDILSTYALYDQQHTRELLRDLRQGHVDMLQDGDDYLLTRLANGITLRRRHFKYWKRHRDKLSVSTIVEESAVHPERPIEQANTPLHNDVGVASPQPLVVLKEAPSQKTGKTMLSATEATHHHQSLDDIVDTKSVTSYAVTVKDIHGKGVNLPPPPKNADGEKDFECPFCYIICPARYGGGRAWRTHLLQDLQPYMCTYPDCEAAEQLFRSRREWNDHEASHRKAWRCPEHPSAVYGSRGGLENHLRQQHLDNFPESQISTIVKIGETSTVEARERCPICFLSADSEGMLDFANHLANHLERIAAFALPKSSEEDADGASSVASRGRSGSTASQDVSGMSLPSGVSDEPGENVALMRESQVAHGEPVIDKSEPQAVSSHALLSLESLQSLPDVSHNRLDALMTDQVTEQDNIEDIEMQAEVATANIEEHIQRMESFKTYLMSLPGAQSVRFFKRYGSWRGHAVFNNEQQAADAVQLFDAQQWPNIKVQQGAEGSRDKLKFSVPNTPGTHWQRPARRLTSETQNTEAKSNSSSSITYDDTETLESKDPVISISDIPTLRELYRLRKLLQRDQSFAPNDSYNRLISFCYHDLTRMSVDAIVNSANSSLGVSRNTVSLNHSIHKAGGPKLTQEAASMGKLKSGQAALTRGHKLPSTYVIHASRPQYGANKGMGQFNVLTECYRSALRIAQSYELKTIAFPCLGAGGCGFPPRVAARVALQEVREFLDSHQTPSFERIIFVVQSALDEKAYTDLFPVFFPPTHGDLEAARSSGVSDMSANRASLAAQLLEARLEVQKVAESLSAELSLFVSEFPKEIFEELHGIDAALASMRGFLLGSKTLHRGLGDLNLLCSVIQTICGSMTELTESAKVMPFSGGRSHKGLWDDYNDHHKMVHEHDLEEFLRDCQDFAQYLDDILTRNGVVLDEMTPVRLRLDSFKAKQRSQDADGAREHLDEVLYAREFQRETYTEAKDIVRMHQMPSISQLYSSNTLENKSTMVKPSIAFNDTVSLIREDITKLDVAVMVNSTDRTFAGMGTLDRKVFNKGGMELREACTKLGVCKEGDVKSTPGFGLPAKHVLHVIPPEQWRKDSKEVLRQMYREILYTAQSLRAPSLAIPAIGTGMLNYPRRDCAALALEEVHRFLETAEPENSLEKIILVTYSSNDEFVYKSLLPVYFPPVDGNVDRALPASHPFPKERPAPPEMISAPKRTLFSSIGDAVRNLGSSRSRKRSVAHTSRVINTYEEHALIGFESHAQACDICKNMEQLYRDEQKLCEHGYPLAQTLLWYMNLGPDQLVYTRPVQIRRSIRLELPEDMFPLSMAMLRFVEKSLREEGRAPFVSPNSTYSTVVQGQPEQHDETAGPTLYNAETARASVEVWSTSGQIWSPVSPAECTLFLRKGRIDVYEAHAPSTAQEPLLTFVLDPTAKITRLLYRNGLVVHGANAAQFDKNEEVMLESQSKADSESLLAMLHRANPEFPLSMEDLEPDYKGQSSARGADREPEARVNATATSAGVADSDTKQESALDVESTGLSPSQAKMKKLGEAPSGPDIESSRPQSASITQPNDLMAPSNELQPANSSPMHDKSARKALTALEHQIFHYLTKDLESRPGSYIGQNTKNIATMLKRSQNEVAIAMKVLAKQGYIHNTVDENTWVISRPPEVLPALADPSGGPPKLEAASSAALSGKRAEDTDMLLQMDLLEQQILSYFSTFKSTSPTEQGCTVLHLAEALEADIDELELALDQLAEQGKMHLAPDGKTWNTPLPSQYVASVTSNLERATAVLALANVRNPTEFKDAPPSPVLSTATTDTQSLPVDFGTSHRDESSLYPFDPATRWTRLDASYVDPQVLTELDEEFHEDGYSLVVHRVLRRGELNNWVQKTIELRLKKGEGAKASKGVSGHNWLSRDNKSGQSGREERDLHQANLDRVLAGDMREDEIRHFRREEEAERR